MSMTKIFHWVFGSFFRTIGKLIAYLLVGFLIGWVFFVLSNNKLPKISNILNDIFFMKVDALSLDGNISRTIELASSSYNFFLDNDYQTDTWNINDFNSNEDDYIVIPVKGIKYFINKEEVNSDNYLISLEKSYIQAYILSSNPGYTRSCEFQNNFLVCPLGHNQTYTSITLNRWTGGRPGTDSEDDLEVRIQLDNYPQLYKKDTNSIISNQNQNTQSIINNQNQNNQAIINNQNQNNQAIINNQNQQTQVINNTITDESAPSNLSNLSNNNMVGWLPPGPVDSLINLPLVLLNSLQNSLSSTCSPVTLTLPFVNSDIILPCMSTLYQSMGVSGFVNWAGIVASAFILFSYLIRFYKWVDNTLTFRENNWLDNWGGE